MTCVSQWRATVRGVLFTFATAVLFGPFDLGCSVQNTRVRMRSAAIAKNSAPTAEAKPTQAPPTATNVVNGLMLERVADVHLTIPWEVQFVAPCTASGDNSGQRGLPSVQLRGDLVADGYELRVKLDAATSRAVPARQVERAALPIVQLVDAWTGFGVGRHRLAVFAARSSDERIPLDDSGKPAVAFCDFDVESTGRALPVSSPVDTALLTPEGTFHGPDSSQLVVQTFVVQSGTKALGDAGAGEVPWRLFVQRPDGGRDTHPIQPGAYRLLSVRGEPLAGGDYDFWIARDETGSFPHSSPDTAGPRQTIPARTHTITINPE